MALSMSFVSIAVSVVSPCNHFEDADHAVVEFFLRASQGIAGLGEKPCKRLLRDAPPPRHGSVAFKIPYLSGVDVDTCLNLMEGAWSQNRLVTGRKHERILAGMMWMTTDTICYATSVCQPCLLDILW